MKIGIKYKEFFPTLPKKGRLDKGLSELKPLIIAYKFLHE